MLAFCSIEINILDIILFCSKDIYANSKISLFENQINSALAKDYSMYAGTYFSADVFPFCMLSLFRLL